jgi:hypothetical protein
MVLHNHLEDEELEEGDVEQHDKEEDGKSTSTDDSEPKNPVRVSVQKDCIFWHSEKTPFLCHLLRMRTTTNGHLHDEERTFKP